MQEVASLEKPGGGTSGRIAALALDQAVFAAALLDTGGRITQVNHAFTELTGYSPDEALGHSLDLLCCGAYDVAYYQDVFRRLAEGEEWAERVPIGRKDGGSYRSRSVASPIRDEEGAIVAYSFYSRDTSDEAAMEAQLGHLQKMEAIGEMAAGIAHEINTPIQYVGDNLQFLKDACGDLVRLIEALDVACEAGRSGPIPEGNLEMVEALRQEVDWAFLRDEIPLAIDQALEGRNRVAAIVRAMKEFAHPGDDELAPVDVNHAIENTLAVSRGEWKNVAEMELDLAPDLPHVPCYPGSFNQVLLNLVVNASHAVADVRDQRGGRGIIHIGTAQRDGSVEVIIRDNGCGIPKEHIRRIFEPFFTTKDIGKGTGQGLALAHAVVVDRMKGQIEVHSVPGEGTEFLLRLPLEGPQEQGEHKERAALR